MKLKELIERVNKEHPHETNTEKVAREFNLDFYGWVEDNKLISYAIEEWLCTDTWVGVYAIYLDGEPVGISCQTARKSDTQYKWISEEKAQKVKEYILSVMEEDEPVHELLTDEELEEDWGEMFQLGYSSQILGKTVWFNDVECSIVDRGGWGKNDEFSPSEIKINYNDEDIVVSMNQVYFPYKIS